MNVVFKKNESVITLRTGTAWSFWFALVFPWIGLLAFLHRRLFIQAAIVVAYIVAQTYLRQTTVIWLAVIDLYPAAEDYTSDDTYMVGLLLWFAYGLFIAGYALWGNRRTARSLFRRGYECPLQDDAAIAESYWSLSLLKSKTRESGVESIRKETRSKSFSMREIRKELKFLIVMIPLVVIGSFVYIAAITPRTNTTATQAVATASAPYVINEKIDSTPFKEDSSPPSIASSEIQEDKILDTRAGVLSLTGEMGTYDLYLDGKKIRDGSQSMSLGFKRKYDFSDREVILATDTQSAACQMYFFITLIGKADIKVSPSFGTCDDSPAIVIVDKKITLTMTNLQGQKTNYYYEDGNIFEQGKLIRNK